MKAERQTREMNILDPQQLLKMAENRTPDGRALLTQSISNFFKKDLTEAERALAGDILLNLVRQAERDLRQALAERLAALDNVPQNLIVFLANDEFSVAEPVLRHSPLLNDVDLLYIIGSKPAEYWHVISQREKLTPIVADRLIETGDTITVQTLIENKSVTFTSASMRKLARAAANSEAMQASLLRRPEVNAELATDLYLCVSNELRREIQKRFAVSIGIIDRAMEQLVQEMTDAARGRRDTTDDMLGLATRLQERGEITVDLLLRTLRRGQIGFFIALLSRRLGMEPMTVVKIVEKEGGRPLAVASKSMGIMKSEFASIFLLSRGVRGGDKIVDQRELAMALKCFDSVKDSDVDLILRSWAKNPDII